MDPTHLRELGARLGFPRTRGDGPERHTIRRALDALPPHTRGWTGRSWPWLVVASASPAHAGMDRRYFGRSRFRDCFPRTRGDGPLTLRHPGERAGLPPHTRGWTVLRRVGDHPVEASPAHAGMDPLLLVQATTVEGFPRTRGDGPCSSFMGPPMGVLPPHTRGWTPEPWRPEMPETASPAHAGMDPSDSGSFSSGESFPRTRGDGPRVQEWRVSRDWLPPHTRGWTPDARPAEPTPAASPAHAGMDPRGGRGPDGGGRFPRTRGDGPRTIRCSTAPIRLPPHTRGWTRHRAAAIHVGGASPAHAGMDRSRRRCRQRDGGFPRTRGDGPSTSSGPCSPTGLPPHTRGWTRHSAESVSPDLASPAHAGMDLAPRSWVLQWGCFPRTRGDGPVRITVSPSIR